MAHFRAMPTVIRSTPMPVFLSGAVAAVLCCVSLLFADSAGAQDRVVAVPSSAAEITLSFAPVVRQAAPAVVNIHTARRRTTRSPFVDDPIMRHFFGRGGRRNSPMASALGSGVIVDPSGLVVTNAHVIRGAREIRVSLNDRREYAANLLLKDERTDLAVLKIESDQSFPSLAFGSADGLDVGDLVLAIGNPFGVGQTVTQGIVSAVARTQVGVADYRFFIQTDAAINPGNSGGALIDMSGRLVGINTAIYSRSGGSNGIGFAIPVEMVRIVVQSAADGGKVRRPWFGARLQSVTRDLSREFGLDRPSGAIITELVPRSPAHQAGLKVADVITHLDAVEVVDSDTFGYLYATKGLVGETEVRIVRSGTVKAVRVSLAAPPETTPRDAQRIAGRSPFSGVIAMNLSPAVADEFNLDLADTGVVIARVDPRSVASRVGLRSGDKVIEVNGERVRNTASLKTLSGRRERYWEIIIERNGQQLELVLGG
ncbi:MAG: Do family serine endopeptidase [Devosia sp.]